MSLKVASKRFNWKLFSIVIIIIFIGFVIFHCLTPIVYAQDSLRDSNSRKIQQEYKLTELDMKEIENVKLKSQVFQLSKIIAEQQLQPIAKDLDKSYKELVDRLRLLMGADKDDVFNMDTLKFDKVKKEEVKDEKDK